MHVRSILWDEVGEALFLSVCSAGLPELFTIKAVQKFWKRIRGREEGWEGENETGSRHWIAGIQLSKLAWQQFYNTEEDESKF